MPVTVFSINANNKKSPLAQAQHQLFQEKKNGHLPIFLALHSINVLSAMKAEPHAESQRLC
jgi:hypothetical protein